MARVRKLEAKSGEILFPNPLRPIRARQRICDKGRKFTQLFLCSTRLIDGRTTGDRTNGIEIDNRKEVEEIESRTEFPGGRIGGAGYLGRAQTYVTSVVSRGKKRAPHDETT